MRHSGRAALHTKINVLHVLDTLAEGGAEQTVLNLVAALDGQRFSSVVATLFSREPGRSEPLADEARLLGVPVYQTGMASWKDLSTMKAFLSIVDRHDIDILHSQTVYSAFWSALILRLSGRLRQRIVYTRQNAYVPRDAVSRLQTRILTFLAGRIIAVSRSTERNLVSVCGVLPQKIVRIPNSVDIDRFSPSVSGENVRAEIGVPALAPIVGNISRIEARKGYDTFLAVALLVLRQFPEAVFLVAGRDREHGKHGRMASEMGIGDRVHFLGARRDIPDVLAAMDVFLFTPHWGEGLPLCLLEAMATAKPVVASNVGANAEIVADGVSGFLASPGAWSEEVADLDPGPLAERVCLLMGNSELASRMGEAGRRIVETGFSHRRAAAMTEELYKELLGRMEVRR